MHKIMWWGDLRKRDDCKDTDVGGRIILKCTLKAALDGAD